jgi:hypothetical protein
VFPPFDYRFRLGIEGIKETDFKQEYGRVNIGAPSDFFKRKTASQSFLLFLTEFLFVLVFLS